MDRSEIAIGSVYRCKGGWYRRPTQVFEKHGGEYVAYDLGWTQDVDKSNSSGPMPWFAQAAIEKVK